MYDGLSRILLLPPSLHTVLGTSFAAGMVLAGLEEPAFTTSSADLAPRWGNCGEIAPVLVARLRVPGP